MPVRIVTRKWVAGGTCPAELRIEMNDGRIRRYTLAEEKPAEGKTGNRLEESWAMLKDAERESAGEYRAKHIRRAGA